DSSSLGRPNLKCLSVVCMLWSTQHESVQRAIVSTAVDAFALGIVFVWVAPGFKTCPLPKPGEYTRKCISSGGLGAHPAGHLIPPLALMELSPFIGSMPMLADYSVLVWFCWQHLLGLQSFPGHLVRCGQCNGREQVCCSIYDSRTFWYTLHV